MQEAEADLDLVQRLLVRHSISATLSKRPDAIYPFRELVDMDRVEIQNTQFAR